MRTANLNTLQKINIFAIGLPIFPGVIGIFSTTVLVWALLSLMLAGFLQISIAIGYFLHNKKNMLILIYFAGVILFFILAFTDILLLWNTYFLWPLLLCIYLTCILHIKKY